jgi:hypothetical protein
MNALIASVLVAFVSAVASIIVALITARSRIGVLPAKSVRDSSSPSDIQLDFKESEAISRVWGWLVVLSLYLVAVFCLLQGLNDVRISRHWDQWATAFGSLIAERAEIDLYAKFWLTTAVALIIIGYWGQRRLRRRSR